MICVSRTRRYSHAMGAGLLCVLAQSCTAGDPSKADIAQAPEPQLVFPDHPPLAHRHRNHSLTEAPGGTLRVYAAQRGDVTDLMVQRKGPDGKWSAPNRLDLPRRDTNTSPRFFPDGTLYYASDAPHPDRPGRKDLNIWRVKLDGNMPSPPEVLPDSINTGSSEDGFAPLGLDGAVFSSTTLGGEGGYDLYFAKFEEDEWQVSSFPQNTVMTDSHPATTPDGQTLFWYAHLPADAVYGAVDLFVSQYKDGVWSQAENLGPRINSDGIDYGPGVSADGKYLFYSQNGRLYQTALADAVSSAGFVRTEAAETN